MPKQKTVAVTGASGHIGFHVAKILLHRGYNVLLLTRRINENIEDLIEHGGEALLCDLFDPSTYQESIKDVSAMFHLAAANTTDTTQPDEIVKSTVDLTKTITNCCIEANIETLVYTSSVVVLGRSQSPERLITLDDEEASPANPYIRGKVEAERFLEEVAESGGIDVRRLYPSWVLGPNNANETPPHRFIRDFIEKGQRFYFAGGISVAHVEAVARAHVEALEKGRKNGRYLLGGQNVTFREFYHALADETKETRPAFLFPKMLMVFAAKVLQAVARLSGLGSPPEPSFVDSVVGSYSWYDSAASESELGYRIPDLNTTLKTAVGDIRLRSAKINIINRLSVPEFDGDVPAWFVTGATGWLGHRFLRLLVDKMKEGEIPPAPIRLYCEEKFRDFFHTREGIDVVFGDLGDKAKMEEALTGVGTVCHCAGLIYPSNTALLYKVNAEGTKNLVDACISSGVRRFLYIGTDSICGRGSREKRIFDESTSASPYRHYGRSKYLGEEYVLSKTAEGKIAGTSLRGFWFFGPGAPPRQENFMGMFSWKRQIVFGNGKNYRSITSVDNLANAMLLAAKSENSVGKWYWIGDSKPDYTVDEIYQKLAAHFGSSYRPFYIPAPICMCLNFVDLLMSKFGKLHPTIHAAGKFYFDIAGTIEAAQRDFDYDPVLSLDEEISRIPR